jgi:hypothetical protein
MSEEYVIVCHLQTLGYFCVAGSHQVQLENQYDGVWPTAECSSHHSTLLNGEQGLAQHSINFQQFLSANGD